jgi:DNA topoisomerase VI subunit A
MSKNETIRELYYQCKDMDIEETIELVLDAKTQEEQEFFFACK